MNNKLMTVAIRNNHLFIPNEWIIMKNGNKQMLDSTSKLVKQVAHLGYQFSDDLQQEINLISAPNKTIILNILEDISDVKKDWTPLVKQWDIPTKESINDHIYTFFSNLFKLNNGVKLPCGHTIPNGTFPIERYNGCPYCGTPFNNETYDYSNNDFNKKEFKLFGLWGEGDLQKHFLGLLKSPVPLDKTQIESLKTLIQYFGYNDEAIIIKETLMIIIEVLVDQNKFEKAGKLLLSPNDILRFLWYKHTGFLQIIRPKTIRKRSTTNHRNVILNHDKSKEELLNVTKGLKLKFSRADCRMYASWLNNIGMDIQQQCEIMHPKRGIWVRVIRALRLTEYSKKSEFENLSKLLDSFYLKKYTVWHGELMLHDNNHATEKMFTLLKQRPGTFARSLFSTMLKYGGANTKAHFEEIIDKIPMRLIVTIYMYTDIYFDKNESRIIKALGGINKTIPTNKRLKLYSDDELSSIKQLVKELCCDKIEAHFSSSQDNNKTIYIGKGLYNIPITIGDRTETIQNQQTTLMGTRFKVQGDKVRIFLQWGVGLKAQHLDMDLSCHVSYVNKSEYCSYSQLMIPGCKHSGDIQSIPNDVGTAEYIDIDLEYLVSAGAKYVSFSCNAYTNGSLAPNLVLGWMTSLSPMKIDASGVAFNPLDVQHKISLNENLIKGLLFGVLDIKKKEIIWLEMSFKGRVVQNMDSMGMEVLLKKLDAKIKIGEMLEIKAKVQNMTIIKDSSKADEMYDLNWAQNTAGVNALLL